MGRIETELAFIRAVATAASSLSICQPIAAASGCSVVCEEGLAVVVFEYAPGAPTLAANRWMKDTALISEWGAWLAKFHAAARHVRRDSPSIYQSIRPWDALHDGLLLGQPVDPADEALAASDAAFGILHGDLNASNFFVTEDEGRIVLHVFDWDQVQKGWFMYDLALPLWGCTMLAGAGEFPSGEPISGADPDRFAAALVEGYESVAGQGAVDRSHLLRMLDIRRDFYEKFCRRSLERKDLPEGVMTDFVKFVVAWFDKQKKTQ